MVRRWLPMLAVSFTLLHSVPACIGGGDEKLNPQPLPPGDPDKGTSEPTPGENGGSTSSSGGDSASAPKDASAGDVRTSDAGGDI
jgi:hypothetical protein